jgi:hypothetical protein
MSLIVIGGHSRSVGKTSVVAGIIAAVPEHQWTAFKITQYGHGICSRDGQPCDCVVEDDTQEHPFAITEENDRSGETDTSRFLVSGAARSLWVRTRQGFLEEAMPRILRELDRSENAIIESNSILRFLQPDIYITVLDPANPDFKKSAAEFLGCADAIILDEPAPGHLAIAPAWDGVALAPLSRKPIFRVHPPEYVTAEIVEFVRQKLETHAVRV